MNVDHVNPKVQIKPRCDECGSTNTGAVRTKGLTGGLWYRGRKCRASTQYRKCRDCGYGFKVTLIKAPIGADAPTSPARPG